MKRILSIDGGGLRGIIPALWLARLEQELEGKAHREGRAVPEKGVLWDSFDFFVGASTGSILALGLAHGLRARDLVELYRENAQRIFPRRTLFKKWLGYVSGPAYDRKWLESVLQKSFCNGAANDPRLANLQKPVMVPVYDMLGGKPILFKSWHASYSKHCLWEIAAASSSGPTYLAPMSLMVEGKACALVDGGVVANNPVAFSVVEALSGKPFVHKLANGGWANDPTPCAPDELRVLSLGTGEGFQPRPISKVAGWGQAQWILPDKPIIELLFDGSSDSMLYMASQLVPPANFCRWQCDLATSCQGMDDFEILPYWERRATETMESEGFRNDLERVMGWLP